MEKKSIPVICILFLAVLGCASSGERTGNNNKASQYQLAMEFNNLGARYVSKNLFDEAIVQFRKSITVYPNFTEA
ncbi:MAG: hypothetical protein AAB422_02985, partial [Planctomycetota bacterium]